MGKGGVVKCGGCGKHFADGGKVQRQAKATQPTPSLEEVKARLGPAAMDAGVTVRPPKRALEAGESLAWKRKPAEAVERETTEQLRTPFTPVVQADPPAGRSGKKPPGAEYWTSNGEPVTRSYAKGGVVEGGKPLIGKTPLSFAARLAVKNRGKASPSFSRRTMKAQP